MVKLTGEETLRQKSATHKEEKGGFRMSITINDTKRTKKSS